MDLLKWAIAASAWALLQAVLRSPEDADLARRLRARDPRVMSTLYDRYGKLAYSLIFRMVRDGPAAEDLVQETFLRVWNRTRSFDAERGALGPWLLAVARNRAIDYVRSSGGKMARGALELEYAEQPAVFVNFEAGLLSQDRARRVRAALERLNGNQRQVIELAYFEGLS